MFKSIELCGSRQWRFLCVCGTTKGTPASVEPWLDWGQCFTSIQLWIQVKLCQTWTYSYKVAVWKYFQNIYVQICKYLYLYPKNHSRMNVKISLSGLIMSWKAKINIFHYFILVQCKLLHVSTIIVINFLDSFLQSLQIFDYSYHSFIAITNPLLQSDSIYRLSLCWQCCMRSNGDRLN